MGEITRRQQQQHEPQPPAHPHPRAPPPPLPPRPSSPSPASSTRFSSSPPPRHAARARPKYSRSHLSCSRRPQTLTLPPHRLAAAAGPPSSAYSVRGSGVGWREGHLVWS